MKENQKTWTEMLLSKMERFIWLCSVCTQYKLGFFFSVELDSFFYSTPICWKRLSFVKFFLNRRIKTTILIYDKYSMTILFDSYSIHRSIEFQMHFKSKNINRNGFFFIHFVSIHFVSIRDMIREFIVFQFNSWKRHLNFNEAKKATVNVQIDHYLLKKRVCVSLFNLVTIFILIVVQIHFYSSSISFFQLRKFD